MDKRYQRKFNYRRMGGNVQPMQIYLYDWWPMRRKEKILSKLSTIPVEMAKKRHGRNN